MIEELNSDLISTVVSAVLNIITILSSAIFLFVNIKVNRKSTAREIQRQVFANFYLPVKFKLGYINNILQRYPTVDIFTMKNEDALYVRRRYEILNSYQDFVDWIAKEQYCCSQNIDKLIFKVAEHMQFVLVYQNDEKKLKENENIYPIPDFDSIVQEIDREFDRQKFI